MSVQKILEEPLIIGGIKNKEDRIQRIHKAMEEEECKKLFEQVGLERVYLGPEEAGPWIKNQNDFFKLIATKVALQPQ
jgi:tripartite-type tricarboxylate transporter receptor subunit TctC